MKRAISFVGIGLLLVALPSTPPKAASTTPPATPASTSSGDGAQSAAVTAPPAASLPKPEVIAKDSPRTTAAGHTFTAPAGWTLTPTAPARVLEGPEKDVKLALVDVPHAADAADAVKQAWPSLDPKFARPLRIAQDLPARFGWEGAELFVYETSPNEKRNVLAVARKKGDGVVRAARRRRRRGDRAARQRRSA